ncbi:hypothetical protein JXO52_13910 [bacterium]|nr:hypothetical protein [bacterium]
MKLTKYSMGIGDRFMHQGRAQLAALASAREAGVEIAPVWNKSYREHQIIHSQPEQTRREADAAVKALAWNGPYFVDADHIGLKTVDLFLDSCDFFTLDVADFIGEEASAADVDSFVAAFGRLAGDIAVPGLDDPLSVTVDAIRAVAETYLFAVQEAGRIYRYIQEKKSSPFVVEVSMDETASPQTPAELLFILAAISMEGIPAQTIAPKFSGRFNKGVDYAGDTERFRREFEQDLAVIAWAVKEFSLPSNLKLSVHSGSDKFAIYGAIRDALRRFDAGLHLKTAGTTWLEELIGLAEAGGDGLDLAKNVYRGAYARRDELCGPYATVIDIDPDALPSPEAVDRWSGGEYTSALRHDPANPGYNPNVRQLLHVGYKVAAEMGERYLHALRVHEAVIARNVTGNLLERHIKRIFL